MVFSSIEFIFYFLPIFFMVYTLLPWKNIVLLVFSLLFYIFGELQYSLLLLFSIGINYGCGLWIASAQRLTQKWILAAGISVNLAILAIFKYLDFFIENLNKAIDAFSGHAISSPNIQLPLGISFFTFQSISYLVDVWRKDARAEKNIILLAAYISMFPQLIAGPIVRFKTVAEEFHHRQVSPVRLAMGIQIFVTGLAQKVLIANTVALPADRIFSLAPNELSQPLAWLGLICYTLQIYFDFAGYSNMAIGLGHMLGFTFPNNFHFPYASQSITKFWRRWHISLSTWFRDYLYIPLGGNRVSPLRTYLNLWIVFLLCGFWHGAAWNFILWGAYNGTFLILERVFFSTTLQSLPRVLRHAYALLVIAYGWLIFRVESLSQLGIYSKVLLGYPVQNVTQFSGLPYVNIPLVLAIVIGMLVSVPTISVLKKSLRTVLLHKRPAMQANFFQAVSFSNTILLTLLSASALASGTYNPFIYFRF